MNTKLELFVVISTAVTFGSAHHYILEMITALRRGEREEAALQTVQLQWKERERALQEPRRTGVLWEEGQCVTPP